MGEDMVQPNPSAGSASSQELQDNIALGLWEEDESVLNTILTHYGPPIIKALMKMFTPYLNAQDCEDILSVAVLRLWEARATYDEKKASVRTLLYKIAVNYARDVLRSGWHRVREMEQQTKPDLLEELAVYDRHAAQIGAEADDPPPAGHKVEESKLMRDFREVFGSLPKIQQNILEQDALAGGEEVDAAALGERLEEIPAVTIRVYRKRAKDTVKAEMKKRGHNLDRKGTRHE